MLIFTKNYSQKSRRTRFFDFSSCNTAFNLNDVNLIYAILRKQRISKSVSISLSKLGILLMPLALNSLNKSINLKLI